MDRSQAHPSVSEQNREKFESVNPYVRYAMLALDARENPQRAETAQVYATLAVAFQNWAQR